MSVAENYEYREILHLLLWTIFILSMKVERVKVNQFSCRTEKITLLVITIIVTVSWPLTLPVLYLIVMKIIIYYHRLHRTRFRVDRFSHPLFYGYKYMASRDDQRQANSKKLQQKVNVSFVILNFCFVWLAFMSFILSCALNYKYAHT